ncbi:MAG: hypothetical protein EOP87_16315, partial [Verrucomicrobiaceae bacterium]
MKTHPPLILRLGFFSLMTWGLIGTSGAVDVIDHLRKTSMEEVEIANTQAMFKKAELGQKYIAALDALEKTLAAAGKLDVIVHVREEREEVKKTGDTTRHEDKPLVDLRAKYLKSMEGIDAETKAAKAKVAEGIARKIREQETALTKSGKVEDALNLRKQGESLMLEISGGTAAESVAFADDPRSTTAPGAKSLEK